MLLCNWVLRFWHRHTSFNISTQYSEFSEYCVDILMVKLKNTTLYTYSIHNTHAHLGWHDADSSSFVSNVQTRISLLFQWFLEIRCCLIFFPREYFPCFPSIILNETLPNILDKMGTFFIHEVILDSRYSGYCLKLLVDHSRKLLSNIFGREWFNCLYLIVGNCILTGISWDAVEYSDLRTITSHKMTGKLKECEAMKNFLNA